MVYRYIVLYGVLGPGVAWDDLANMRPLLALYLLAHMCYAVYGRALSYAVLRQPWSQLFSIPRCRWISTPFGPVNGPDWRGPLRGASGNPVHRA